MTTHPQRWLSRFGAFCAVIVCALLACLAFTGQSVAQPSAAVIMDVRTGEVIQSSNPDARLHPASLTKMMTLYIAFEAVENGEISLDTRVRISRHAASQPPSRLGLRAGQRISFRYLIRAAALRSANDAATAIAEALEGSVANFSARMNRTARAIGMTRTNFRNPHGLTQARHLSTARDMSRLGRQLYFDYPDYYNIFSRLSENAGIATVRNTNRRFLNGYRGADGIKTGFTNAAGYNLVGMAARGNVRILVAVMGARSSNHRYQRITTLMDRGFRLAPRRAATRRPSRPNYVRAPEDRGSGVAAGRTIRLQTAPRRSRFPRARPPRPGEAPSEELVAALRTEIDAVIEEIRPNETDIDAEVLAEAGSEEPVALALAAPERSMLPRRRPETASPAPATQLAQVDVTRAGGTTAIDPEQLEALTEAEPEMPPAQTPEVPPAQAVETVVAATPLQFDHAAVDVAGVTTQDGVVQIPGLPTIASVAEAPHAEAPSGAVEQTNVARLSPIPQIEPTQDELSVDAEGRVMWRDEEVLTALADEDPTDPVLAPSIILTSSDSDDPPLPTPMPEIVARVSTSGGRVWAVNLGQFNSHFDAERYLLRVSLSENGTLGAGVRRVASRGGNIFAEIHSLTQDSAETACRRLDARRVACEVIAPES